MLAPWKDNYEQPRQHIKKQRHCFANKGPSRQGYGFSSGHVWMWELDYEESWAPKNWCFWTVVLEKTFESPLDCKKIQPVHPKGDQSWLFFGRTDAKAETPILWPPDAKNWLTGKDPDAGKDWGQEEKGTIEDEMAGSPTQWTWVWLDSESWWWTGRPGVLQSMGSQRVRHNWVTELNHTDTLIWSKPILVVFLFLPPFINPRCLHFVAVCPMSSLSMPLNRLSRSHVPYCWEGSRVLQQQHSLAWSRCPVSACGQSESEKWKWSRSAVSNSLRPLGETYQASLSVGVSRQEYWSGSVGDHFLLQGIFPTQGSNPGLPHGRQTLSEGKYMSGWT